MNGGEIFILCLRRLFMVCAGFLHSKKFILFISCIDYIVIFLFKFLLNGRNVRWKSC